MKRLQARVIAVAEQALAQRKVVAPIDVLLGIEWLQPARVEDWRRGRLPYLERVVTANLHKISVAMHLFRSWAVRRGLKPSETVYVSWTRPRHRLRFSKSGQESVERGYRTHWVSPALSEAKRQRLQELHSQAPDLADGDPTIEPTLSSWP